MVFIKLPELDQTSVFDIVEENFQRLKLRTYAVRLLYIGEHTRKKEDMIQCFSKTINDVNSEYCEIPVYGVLLVYDSYFVHILEGSEDTLHRHLRFLFKNEVAWIEEMRQAELKAEEALEEPEDPELSNTTLHAIRTEKEGVLERIKNTERRWFRRLKMLTIYHSVSSLMFSRWSAFTARPPSLIGTLDIHAPAAAHLEQLKICLDKIRRFSILVLADPDIVFEGLSAADPRIDTLPEVALLDFLLQSPHLLELRRMFNLHRRVDDYVFYFEQVWPLPTHFTPRYLYKLTIDDSFVEPLPVMPWEIKKETEDEEEEHSASESSD